ncbi:hypothetical protein JOE40_000396 [Arthrobacter sp. PvP102]|uniref:DUF1579 family protein n=1 Tax=unclassified Arthrobacter TaxID=235627 RepID=UPI0000527158|nr:MULTISPECIES: DUF1579 family protein [unclassified Arthrobacter]ABK02830.1 conserved hypothetical protein [Arthrobacter sp. FB24]MBP1234929.1 hypothetical protein [Arthrobacter sp. PvP103]MBP1235887.1 hypothetical protein [Arthrobacter sp. PvP102]
MDRTHPGTAQAELEVFLGHWTGTTHIEATPRRPARTAAAEMTFTKAAGGYAVLQSYRHTQLDGIRFERHGMFTMDPDHPDTVWYHVDSVGLPREPPTRCSWHGGVLTVERRTGRDTSRHTYRVDDGVLTHTSEVRLAGATAFAPFMTSVCRRT